MNTLPSSISEHNKRSIDGLCGELYFELQVGVSIINSVSIFKVGDMGVHLGLPRGGLDNWGGGI